MSTPKTNKCEGKTDENLSRIRLGKHCRVVVMQDFLVTVCEISGDAEHKSPWRLLLTINAAAGHQATPLPPPPRCSADLIAFAPGRGLRHFNSREPQEC